VLSLLRMRNFTEICGDTFVFAVIDILLLHARRH
jgi:hypothetical protein